MRFLALGLAVLAATIALVPAAAAQAEPVSGCDPATCDPLVANGGHVHSGDDPVRVILYAHVKDLLQRAPLNTQFPGPEEEDVNAGFLVPTVYTTSPQPHGFHNNEFNWFLSPGLVEYLADGWRIRNQPGLGGPVGLASDEVTLFFYVSPGYGASSPEAPHVMPAAGVYAQVNLGRNPSDDPRLLVAVGDTGTGYGSAEPGQAAGTSTLISLPGEDPVYEFRVPMEVLRDRLPGIREAADFEERGAIVHIVFYQLETEGASFTDGAWRIRTGPQFAPRVLIDMHRPLVTDMARIHTYSDSDPVNHLYFRWAVRAALGAYDVDPDSIQIHVDGPTPIEPELVIAKYSVDHDGAFKPVNVTWRHNLTARPLTDGAYHVTASAMNRQATYRVVWNHTFHVADGQPQVKDLGPARLEGSAELPAPGAFGAMLASVLVLLLLRRRPTQRLSVEPAP